MQGAAPKQSTEDLRNPLNLSRDDSQSGLGGASLQRPARVQAGMKTTRPASIFEPVRDSEAQPKGTPKRDLRREAQPKENVRREALPTPEARGLGLLLGATRPTRAWDLARVDPLPLES